MKAIKKILKFLANWSEFVWLFIGIILWSFSSSILHWVDPTAATYDAGIFQIILFAIIQFFIFSGIVWIYLKTTFSEIYKWLDNELGSNLTKMTKWESAKVVLWLLSLFFISIVLLARVV